jgi:AcrR family transcriptional regulator
MAGAARANRGPSAAAENRRALVAAAVEVFGEQGIDAPLSAVAKTAGVGQGSLYRHFPDRMSLALAAFEDNVAELEELAAQDGTVLDDLLALVTEQTIASVAFVEIVTSAGDDDDRLEAVTARVSAALERAVRDARRRGDLRRGARTADVLLALGMVAAIVAKTPTDQRPETAAAAWSILHRGLDR